MEAWEVSGVPTDCVNVGLTELWPEGCDLILSGINKGPNLGFDITYSGTVAGAMEGAINGIRSIAVSMAAFESDAAPHFETGRDWLDQNWDMLLALPMEDLTFLNVNIPALPMSELKGWTFARMGERVYKDRVERRLDPWGKPYHWQGGIVVVDPGVGDSDASISTQGYVTVTPLSLDWTSHRLLQEFEARRQAGDFETVN
jgi:5'-nucleotidase